MTRDMQWRPLQRRQQKDKGEFASIACIGLHFEFLFNALTCFVTALVGSYVLNFKEKVPSPQNRASDRGRNLKAKTWVFGWRLLVCYSMQVTILAFPLFLFFSWNLKLSVCRAYIESELPTSKAFFRNAWRNPIQNLWKSEIAVAQTKDISSGVAVAQNKDTSLGKSTSPFFMQIQRTMRMGTRTLVIILLLCVCVYGTHTPGRGTGKHNAWYRFFLDKTPDVSPILSSFSLCSSARFCTGHKTTWHCEIFERHLCASFESWISCLLQDAAEETGRTLLNPMYRELEALIHPSKSESGTWPRPVEPKTEGQQHPLQEIWIPDYDLKQLDSPPRYTKRADFIWRTFFGAADHFFQRLDTRTRTGQAEEEESFRKCLLNL